MPGPSPILLAITTALTVEAAAVDPYALLALAPFGAPRFAWRAFDDATTYVGFGAEAMAVADAEGDGDGEDAFAIVQRALRAVTVRLIEPSGRTVPHRPRWFGGFAFDPAHTPSGPWSGFPAAFFALPTVQWALGRDRVHLTLCGPAADPQARMADVERWTERTLRSVAARPVRRPSAGSAGRATVAIGDDADVADDADRPLVADARSSADPALSNRLARAIAALAAGAVSKVVVATSRTVPFDAAADAVDAADVARAAALAAPGCTSFLIAPTADAAWLGATPERLVRVRGRQLRTMALAGTARRGATAAADRDLGAALFASDKDRREHAAVVDAVTDALSAAPGLAGGIVAAPGPRLRRLATMQHLETPIAARGETRLDVLDIARRLHPTPALAGWPRAAALALIDRLEPDGRGWYGGAVGWIDAAGDGDLAVGIRAVLVGAGGATAFAGAGLVVGSEAAAEAREIALKLDTALRPVVQALAVATQGGSSASSGAPQRSLDAEVDAVGDVGDVGAVGAVGDVGGLDGLDGLDSGFDSGRAAWR